MISEDMIRKKVIEIIGPKDKVSIVCIKRTIKILIKVLIKDYQVPLGTFLTIGNLFVKTVLKIVKEEKEYNSQKINRPK